MICSPRSRFFASALAAVALCLVTGSAFAQNASNKAEAHLTRGQKLFADGKYQEAIEELRAGYVLSPQSRFLYALGQAYRLNHQCVDAVKAYRDFIASEPPQSQQTAAEGNIARCGEEDPRSILPPPKVDPIPTDPALNRPVDRNSPGVVVAPVVQEPPRKTPVYKKWWLWTTVGVVVVGAGLGVGLGLGLRGSSEFKSTLPDVGPGAAMGLTVR